MRIGPFGTQVYKSLLKRQTAIRKAAAEEMKRNPPIKGRIRYGKGPLVFE